MQTSLTAAFGTGSGIEGVDLAIEVDQGFYNGGNEIHLLLFPQVGATLRANSGSVSGLGNPKPVPVPGGVVVMNGTTARLPKRGDAVPPTIQVLHAADKTGKEIDPGIVYNSGTNLFTAQRECTAGISFTPYQTFALPFTYSPLLSVGQSGASIATFGTIYGFYPPDNTVVFDAQPYSISQGDLIELYRIVSNTVTTEDGEFEKPPNFPSSGTYPDAALVLPTVGFVEGERTHEIGYTDLSGNADIRRLFVRIVEPYIGNRSYKPPSKRIVESTLPADLMSTDAILRAKNFVAQRGLMKL